MNTTTTPPANATWKKITAVCLSAALLFFGSLQTMAQVIPAVHCNSTAATSTFSNSTPVTITTAAPPQVVTSTILVSGASPYLFDLNVTTFITHTFAGDLDITLTSPAGTVVTLTTDNGGGADNVFNGTIWDDDANPLGQVPHATTAGNSGIVTDHAFVNNVLASPLVPEEALGAFIGEDPNGTWTITISDDDIGDGGSLNSWSLEVTGLAAAPASFFDVFSDSPALAISDVGTPTISSTIIVSGLDPYLLDLNVFTDITHTYTSDLQITITSPAGTVVTLSSGNGGTFEDVFAGTTWDDDADPDGLVPYTTNNGLATDHLYVNLTVATPLVPEEAFAAFIGEDPNGVWTITIADRFDFDGGTLNSWSLDFETVGDVVDPLISCGANITVNNISGTCSSAAVTLTGTASATDACSTPTITYSPVSGSTFPIGTTTVTATATDGAGNTSTCTFDVIVTDIDAPVVTCSPFLLHDNGPLVNSSGTGFGGADESILQTTSLGMSILGFGHDVDAAIRVADDFTISNSNGWTINEIVFYSYQTGSGTTSTMTHYNLQIWDGVPGGGGSVVWGNGVTNLLAKTEWAGIYRVTQTTSGNTSRPVMKNTVSLGGVNLPAGTYWLDWQANGTLASGPWAPPITINGQSTTGNAIQSLDGGVTYAAAVDNGTGTGQGLPFLIFGSESFENDLGDCGATLAILAPTILNECSSVTYTNDFNNTNDASDFYPVGTTTVTWTITDADNNVSTCSFDITVEDTEAPSIDCNVVGGGLNTVASTNVPIAIPDNPIVTSTLTFPSAGTITDINVLNLQGTHTWVGDLEISLTSPQGTVVTLINNSCGSAANFNISLDDEAGSPITCPLNLGNTQIPFAALSAFDGENPNGVWTLTIDDQATGDVGTLTAWSLQITTAPGNTVLASNDAGECQAVVTVPAPTFGDNCTGSSILNNFNNTADASGTYPVGTTTVVWTVTDAAGLTNTCSMSVVVEDTEDPTVTCPGDIAVNNDAGDCGATVTFAATSTDNCPGETIAYSPASGSLFPVGTTVVTATATDLAGNTATCTFNVTVSDTEIPTLVCPANIVQSNDPGQCDAVVTYTAPVGVDNCEPVVTQSLSQSIAPGNSVSCNAGGLHADNSYIRVFDLPALGYTNDFYINSVDVGIETAVGAGGSQPATLNLYSLSGPLNYANMTLLATQAVTVVDQTLSILNIPLTNQLTVPAGTVLVVEFFTPDGQVAGHSFFMGSNALGQTGTSYITAPACGVTQPTSTVTIGFANSQWVINVNAGTLTEQTAGLGSGATYPVGTTTEAYQATDVYGNVATCSFTVTVNDTENPVVNCNIDPIICTTFASTNVPVSIVDNTTITSTIAVGAAGTISDLNVLNLGASHTWTSDLTFTLTSPSGTSVVLFNNLCGSADNVNINLDDEAGTLVACPINVGNTQRPANALSAFDGENMNGTWVLSVNDNATFDDGALTSWSLEICTGFGNVVYASAATGICEALVTIPTPAFSDNCTGAVIENDYNNSTDASDTYPVGTHTVLWTAVDLAGNSSTCTITVIVTDDEAPLIDCPDDVAVNNDLGQCSAVVTFDAPLFSDNCPLPALVPFTSNTSVSIPDNDPLGVSTTQDVSGLNGTTLGTDVFLQSVCLEVAHTWVEDLIVVLTSPNGDQITLVDQPACAGDNLDVCFVPGTGSSINTTGSCGSSPAYSGTFTAEYGDLGALSTGTDPNGVWTLTVSDNFGFDIGSISSWTLTFLDVNGTAQAIQVAGLPSGSLFPVGTTTNTFEITDGAGNTATCSFDVTVSDVEGPVLSCPDVTVDNDPGLCSAVVNYTEPVGVDNCEPYQLTQSLSQSITTFNSVSCNAGGLHTNNSYMRVFDLGALGFSDFYINSVDVGIEQAVGNGGSQPATLNLYSLSGPLTFANLTLLASEAVTVADQTNTVLNIPLSSQLTVPAGTVLVVEFFTPDGQGAGNSLFIGSNAAGQTGDTYLAAADCGVAQPTNVADIGFPGMHWVLNVNAGSLTEFVSGIGTGGTFPVGSTTETYQSTDIYGNVSTCSFDVTVEDVEAPVFTFCPTDITGCEADVNTNYADPTATDNCSVIITQTSGLPSGPFPPGITVNTFVAEDPAGNTATCTFTYTIYPNPVVDFTYFPTCIGEIVYFTANVSLDPALGANIVSYEWQFSDGSGINTDVNPTHVYNAAGDYDVTLTVTTNHGCVTSQTYTVTIHPTPEFTTTVEDASCFGESNGSITVDVTVGDAPISYSINGGPGQGSNVFSGLAAGNYLIAITDVNGCSQSATVTVGQPAALVGSVVSTTEALCFGQASGAAEVTATGGTAPYSYSIDGGASQSSGVFSGLAGGAHVVTVTDDNGCTTTVSVTVGEPAQLVVSAASQPVLCFGDATGSIEVTATGGTGAYEYSADGGANFQSGGSFTGLSAGSYVVVVQDENGCSVSEGVVITQPSAALAATGAVQNVACTGDASGSVVITATGGTGAYSYSSDGGTTTQSSNVFAGLAAGDYTITVTDANGCTTTVDVTVAEPVELLTATATATPVSCNGQGDGQISVAVTGGDAPYEYSFNGGITWQSSSSFSDLAPGTYTVLVNDANGCQVASIVVVTQPAALTVAQSASSNSSCEGETDGSFTVAAAGGTSPYTYTSGGNSNSTGVFSNVSSGTHLVTVTDASGCSASIQVTVGYTNPLPDAAFSWFAAGTTVQFSNQSTNGTSYSWNFGDGNTSTSQNPVHTYAASGTYTVTLIVTNACGSDTITWVIDTNSIGINDPNADASVLNIYPNPNHGQFTLNFTSTGIIGDIQVNVMTIEGKLLMAEQFTVNADTFVRNYSDIELAAGMYIIQFVSQNGTEVKRITVDK